MDERLRDVEGDVTTLKDWRKSTVDPWINEDKLSHSSIRDFITEFRSTEKVTAKLNDERHKSNSSKQNVTLVIATALLALFALLTLMVAYATFRQHAFAIPFNLHSSNRIENALQSTIPNLK